MPETISSEVTVRFADQLEAVAFWSDADGEPEVNVAVYKCPRDADDDPIAIFEMPDWDRLHAIVKRAADALLEQIQ